MAERQPKPVDEPIAPEITGNKGDIGDSKNPYVDCDKPEIKKTGDELDENIRRLLEQSP